MNPPPAALAVVRAVVEDAQREQDQAEDVVARIVAELRDHGWTIAPLDQAA
ncbi:MULTISPECIES: hypothetical protein [Streptomyces]|uniref:hypothetical protein n=1 Tax=Streptomyces TaxID=1883 RepID=UPI000722B1B8|nr:hypothetical protein [Streptomyces sp. FR-008]ALM38211.1 hypothetical protein SFR_1596 [Streptomyces sp. FR-008]KAF0795855.1 hypothetical protein P405_00395 [Streptomyces sp. FR-008]